jgi:hypothetical protein
MFKRQELDLNGLVMDLHKLKHKHQQNSEEVGDKGMGMIGLCEIMIAQAFGELAAAIEKNMKE